MSKSITQLEAIIRKQEELDKLRKSYIGFIGEQLGDNALFLKIRGVTCSERDIKIGVEYRKQMNGLESELSLLQSAKEEKEELITIPKWQLVRIEDVLRQANNIHHSQSKETCFDRCICKTWEFACKALGKEYGFEPEKEPRKESWRDFTMTDRNEDESSDVSNEIKE